MNDSKRYLKKIRALLPVWGSYEKRFYKDIQSNVTEFCNAHPDYTYADLVHEFNSPEENVSQYLTNIDPDYLSNKLSFKKYIKVTCVLLISTILIAVMSWNLFLYTARRLKVICYYIGIAFLVLGVINVMVGDFSLIFGH